MKKNEETWRKMKRKKKKEKKKTNEDKRRKWRKMKKKKKNNEEKMKEKWKIEKMEKFKNVRIFFFKKKNQKRKNGEKWWKKKENEEIWIHTQNTNSRVYHCCCNFFRRNHRRFPMILFRNVSLSRWKSTTNFGVSPFFQGKSDNFHWTWNKNTHLSDENRRTKIANVSPSNNYFSFRIISPLNNNMLTLLTREWWCSAANHVNGTRWVVPLCRRLSDRLGEASSQPGDSRGSVSSRWRVTFELPGRLDCRVSTFLRVELTHALADSNLYRSHCEVNFTHVQGGWGSMVWEYLPSFPRGRNSLRWYVGWGWGVGAAALRSSGSSSWTGSVWRSRSSLTGFSSAESRGCRRPCDHAVPVPAVLVVSGREGASDSTHRQIADFLLSIVKIGLRPLGRWVPASMVLFGSPRWTTVVGHRGLPLRNEFVVTCHHRHLAPLTIVRNNLHNNNFHNYHNNPNPTDKKEVWRPPVDVMVIEGAVARSTRPMLMKQARRAMADHAVKFSLMPGKITEKKALDRIVCQWQFHGGQRSLEERTSETLWWGVCGSRGDDRGTREESWEVQKRWRDIWTAEITLDLVLQARSQMSEDQVNGRQNATVSEMIKQLPQENLRHHNDFRLRLWSSSSSCGSQMRHRGRMEHVEKKWQTDED